MNDADQRLELGAYVGASTDHTRIPYGRGICGQVAESGVVFVVPDVHAQDNYLACSIETKSEIVLPIYKDGKLIGQLDIDSHVRDAFGPNDQALLEKICEEVASALE
jgi:L-methionine (R)-S-oxide reductase